MALLEIYMWTHIQKAKTDKTNNLRLPCRHKSIANADQAAKPKGHEHRIHSISRFGIEYTRVWFEIWTNSVACLRKESDGSSINVGNFKFVSI
jgi:hypothetical protein